MMCPTERNFGDFEALPSRFEVRKVELFYINCNDSVRVSFN